MTHTVYLSPGVEATIRAMAAPQWEVRNSASIVFTALIVRTVGFKNVLKVCTCSTTSPLSFLHHKQVCLLPHWLGNAQGSSYVLTIATHSNIASRIDASFGDRLISQ